MADTEYFTATSLTASTSHLRKLTVGYCLERASYVGAMAWQGPHLAIQRPVMSEETKVGWGSLAYHVAWKSITYNYLIEK